MVRPDRIDGGQDTAEPEARLGVRVGPVRGRESVGEVERAAAPVPDATDVTQLDAVVLGGEVAFPPAGGVDPGVEGQALGELSQVCPAHGAPSCGEFGDDRVGGEVVVPDEQRDDR